MNIKVVRRSKQYVHKYPSTQAYLARGLCVMPRSGFSSGVAADQCRETHLSTVFQPTLFPLFESPPASPRPRANSRQRPHRSNRPLRLILVRVPKQQRPPLALQQCLRFQATLLPRLQLILGRHPRANMFPRPLPRTSPIRGKHDGIVVLRDEFDHVNREGRRLSFADVTVEECARPNGRHDSQRAKA